MKTKATKVGIDLAAGPGQHAMSPTTTKTLLALLTTSLLGCTATIGGANDVAPDAGEPEPEPTPDAAPETPVIECTNPPPQLMIVLDRSGSFARRPDGTLPPNTEAGKSQTRWHIMIQAITEVTEALQEDVQFGLTLFPYDPNGNEGRDCSNLDTWLTEYLPPESNDLACQPGEVLVSPDSMNGAAMDAALDRDNTGLCSYTPIGAGLSAAHAELAAVANPEFQQAAVLITDGADNCDGREGYGTGSLDSADAMAADGIRVYVLGFSGSGEDFNHAHLNDLACAGRTAPSFDENCRLENGVYRAVEAPNTERLYLVASEVDTLTASLLDVAEDACNNEFSID